MGSYTKKKMLGKPEVSAVHYVEMFLSRNIPGAILGHFFSTLSFNIFDQCKQYVNLKELILSIGIQSEDFTSKTYFEKVFFSFF